MVCSTLHLLERASESLRDVAAIRGAARKTDVTGIGRWRLPAELKWCRSGATLASCAWDIAKLATALLEKRLTQAVLIAGAPDAHWQGPASGG